MGDSQDGPFLLDSLNSLPCSRPSKKSDNFLKMLNHAVAYFESSRELSALPMKEITPSETLHDQYQALMEENDVLKEQVDELTQGIESMK